jgi:hypothetical protein
MLRCSKEYVMAQFTQWFRKLSPDSTSRARRPKRHKRVQLAVEGLEDRCLLSNGPLLPIPIHAIQAADSDGQFAASITPAEVKQWVDKTNQVYAAAGVQFYFNPEDPASFSTTNNDLINRMMGDGDPGWNAEEAAANAAAANYPGQMLVIFRYGMQIDPNTHQRTAAGGGFSSKDYNFVVMPGFTDSQETSHYLAHETGHYLGLNHTFPAEFPTLADAQFYFKQHGYDPSAFDADGLSDTPPDPLVQSNEHITPPTTLTLKDGNNNDVVFQLPTTNLMSYYNTPTRTISQQQTDIVRAKAVSRGLNQMPTWAQLVGTTLTINGNVLGANATELLTIDTGAQGILALTLNGSSVLFDPGQVTAINVSSLGSNNTVNVSPGAGNLSLLGATIAINVGGNTSLNVGDFSNAAATTYTVAANGVTRAAAGAPSATINYGQLASLWLATGTGTNQAAVGGSPGPVGIIAGGADAVVIGTAQKLDGIGTVSVDGNRNTTMTVNDQSNPTSALVFKPSTQYTLTGSSLTRTVFYPSPLHGSGNTTTTTINYQNLATLTLNAGNNGPNTVDVEGTSAGTTNINGGTATNELDLAAQSHALDKIGTFVNFSGASAAVVVYDQAATSKTPIAYNVGAVGVTRDSIVNGLKVHTNVLTLPVKSITLYTSQFSGGSPNTVTVASGNALPMTVISGSADAISASGLAVPVTLDAHGGTLTLDDSSLQDSTSGGDTTDVYTVGYTVTDQSVTRKERWHEVEIIDPGSVPPNPADPRPPHKAVVTTNTDFSGTLNYRNVKSLTIRGGQVDDTFAVQSTPAGMPVRIIGGTGFRPPAPGITSGATLNQFIVGGNGPAVSPFIVAGNGSATSMRSQVTLNGSGPNDTLVVDDSLATTLDNVTVTGTQVGAAAADQFFAAGGSLTYGSISSLTLNLSKAANDKAQVTPSAVAAFFINASGTGAELDLSLAGVTNPQETLTGPGTGKFTFGNRQAVSFKNMGTVKTI